MLLTPSAVSPEIMFTDTARYPYLIGGIQIGLCGVVKDGDNEGFPTGTLGMIVLNKNTGNRAILSNHHVLYGKPSYVPTADPRVSQPAPTSVPPDGQPYPNVCARATNGYFGTYQYDGKPYHIDAAVADLTRDDVGRYTRQSSSRISNKFMVPELRVARLGARVWKVGAETGLTYGIVARLEADALGADKPNRMVIMSENDNPFAVQGDSGSVIVDEEERRVVGLLTGGFSEEEIRKSGEHLRRGAFACHIEPVIQKLNIELLQLPVG